MTNAWSFTCIATAQIEKDNIFKLSCNKVSTPKEFIFKKVFYYRVKLIQLINSFIVLVWIS